MKSRKYIFIFLLLIILIPVKANAIGICGAKELSKLSTKAYKIKFNYEIVRSKEEDPYYKITALNVSEEFYITYNDTKYYGSEDNENIVFYERFEPNTEYKFGIYTNENMELCGDAYIVSRKVTTPYYNKYSELDACIEYEEFPLCDENYTGEIKSYADFNKRLKEFVDELKGVEEYKDERTTLQKFIDWCKDNIEITLCIVALIVGILSFFIGRAIYRKVKRTKIKI